MESVRRHQARAHADEKSRFDAASSSRMQQPSPEKGAASSQVRMECVEPNVGASVTESILLERVNPPPRFYNPSLIYNDDESLSEVPVLSEPSSTYSGESAPDGQCTTDLDQWTMIGEGHPRDAGNFISPLQHWKSTQFALHNSTDLLPPQDTAGEQFIFTGHGTKSRSTDLDSGYYSRSTSSMVSPDASFQRTKTPAAGGVYDYDVPDLYESKSFDATSRCSSIDPLTKSTHLSLKRKQGQPSAMDTQMTRKSSRITAMSAISRPPQTQNEGKIPTRRRSSRLKQKSEIGTN